jgi:hypothetical protein
MASELARYAVPVRIVDKAAQRRDKSKSAVVVEQNSGVADRGSAPFVNAGLKVDAVNITTG